MDAQYNLPVRHSSPHGEIRTHEIHFGYTFEPLSELNNDDINTLYN